MDSLNVFIADRTLEILGWILVHAVWQIAAIGFALYLALKLVHHLSSALKYRLCLWAIVLIFGSSVTTGLVLIQKFSEPTPAFSGYTILLSDNTQPVKDKFLKSAQSGYFTSIWSTAVNTIDQHLPLIVKIWFFGALLFLFRFAGDLAAIKNLRNKKHQPVDPVWEDKLKSFINTIGLKKPIQLLSSNHVSVPMTYGFFKPVILFPAALLLNMPMLQLEAILAHELAHIKRNDYVINILQSLLEAFFFFHPVFWWITKCSREYREGACDEMAIAAGIAPRHMALALAEVCNLQNGPMPTSAMAVHRHNYTTLTRIKKILGIKTSHQNPTLLTTISMILSLLLCATILAGASHSQELKVFETSVFPGLSIQSFDFDDSIPPVKGVPLDSLKSNLHKMLKEGDVFRSLPDSSNGIFLGDPIQADQWTMLFKNFEDDDLEWDRMPKLELKVRPRMDFDYKDFPRLEIKPIPPLLFERIPEFKPDSLSIWMVPPKTIQMDSLPVGRSLNFKADTLRDAKGNEWYVFRDNITPKQLEAWQKQYEPKMKEFEKRLEQWQKENQPKIDEFERRLKAWQAENEPKQKEFEALLKQWSIENEPRVKAFEQQIEAWQKRNEEKIKEFEKKLEQWKLEHDQKSEKLKEAKKENQL